VNHIAPIRVVATTVLGLLVGLLVGASVGAAARGWMRLVSVDPEFSWAGTVLIVGAFAVCGFAQGLVVSVRRVTSRRWVVTVTRVFGFMGKMPLFFGAGAIMAPTVIIGGLATHRTDWKTWVRCLAGVVASIPVVVIAVDLHGDWGWSWRWWVGTAGLVALYGVVVRAIRGTMAPQRDGWRLPRIVWVVAAVGVTVAVLLPLVGLGLG
jgi:hypothetical protein